MTVESSLEIYKILLGDRNFEEVIREKNGILVDDKKSQKDLFLLLFKNVLKELTSCEQVGLLQNHAQRTAQVCLFDFIDVDAIVANFTVGNIIKPVDQIGNGCL